MLNKQQYYASGKRKSWGQYLKLNNDDYLNCVKFPQHKEVNNLVPHAGLWSEKQKNFLIFKTQPFIYDQTILDSGWFLNFVG